MQKQFKFFGGEMDGEVRVVHKMDKVLYQPMPKVHYVNDREPPQITDFEPEVYFLNKIWGNKRGFEFYLHEDLSIDELLEEIFT